MIIEEPEVFKSWLIDKLKLLCDAEPEALAKYVYALAKKDKPIPELKETMVQQLEVFLNDATKDFVTLLVDTISEKSYIVNSTPTEASESVETPAKSPEPAKTEPVEKPEPKPERLSSTVSHVVSSSSEKAGTTDNGNKLKRKYSYSPEYRSKYARSKTNRSSSSSGSKSRSRSRSKSKSRSRSRSRSRSWSYEHRHGYRRNQNYRNWSPVSPKRSRQNRKSPQSRSTTSKSPVDHKKGSWKSLADWEKPISPGGTIIQRNLSHPPPRFGTENIYTKKCADFEEKGFCMKGDLCLFDHGTDPVVLDNLETVPFQLPVQTDVLHPPGTESLYVSPLANAPAQMIGPPMNNMEYNPAAPNMEPWPQNNFVSVGPYNNRMVVNKQRELICVQTSTKPVASSQDVSKPPDMQLKPKTFDSTWSGQMSNIKSNSILLKKIPTHLNNISRLNNHFYKFGKINKIQVCYEGQHDAALITFSCVAEAQAAFRSPEPILNNRFIKMFWHQPEKPLSNGTDLQSGSTKPESRHLTLNNVQQSNYKLVKNKVPEITNGAPQKAVENPPTKVNEAFKLVYDYKKKPNEKYNVLKKTLDIHKKKQELLDKLIKQQKDLILLIEKGSLSDDQRSKIFETINSLQVQIEGIKQDLGTAVSLMKPKTSVTPVQKVESEVPSEASEKPAENVDSSDKSSSNDDKQPEDTTSSSVQNFSETQITDAAKKKEKVLSEMQKKILDLKMQMQALTASKKVTQSPKTKTHYNTPNKFVRNASFARNLYPARVKKNVYSLSNAAPSAPAKGVAKIEAATKVDHRPTKLLISGYEFDDETELLQNLAAFGEVEDYISDPTTPSIIVSYKTRKEAELALLKGKMFKDRKLSIMWFNEPLPYKAMKRTLSCSSDHSTDKSLQEDGTSPDYYGYSRKFDSSLENDDSDCDRKSDRAESDHKVDKLDNSGNEVEFNWKRISH